MVLNIHRFKFFPPRRFVQSFQFWFHYVKDFASLGIRAESFPDTDLYPATNILGRWDYFRRDVSAILGQYKEGAC